MNIHPDFEELLRLLEEREIEYMIVGGYAVAYHGHPRFTKDIDLTSSRTRRPHRELRTKVTWKNWDNNRVREQANAAYRL
jgi:hypothetical protein